MTTVIERKTVEYWPGTVFTFVACCCKHDICISRIVTQNTLKRAILRAKFQNFSGEGLSMAFGHSPSPRPLSRNPGSATVSECSCYRQDTSKRQTAIKFTHRPKIRFFAPQGRLVAPIHVKLGRADGHLGPLGCAKFHLNRRRGGNPAPKYQKISTFW